MAYGLVGHLRDVQGVAVCIGVHGNGADSHDPGGADDPAGDFAAVGYQESC